MMQSQSAIATPIVSLGYKVWFYLLIAAHIFYVIGLEKDLIRNPHDGTAGLTYLVYGLAPLILVDILTIWLTKYKVYKGWLLIVAASCLLFIPLVVTLIGSALRGN